MGGRLEVSLRGGFGRTHAFGVSREVTCVHASFTIAGRARPALLYGVYGRDGYDAAFQGRVMDLWCLAGNVLVIPVLYTRDGRPSAR